MGSGGGLFSTGTVGLLNGTLTANEADGGAGGTGSSNGADGPGIGGGAYTSTRLLTLSSCTLTANIAATQAGGLAVHSGQLAPTNNILAGNSAPDSPDLNGNFASQGFNLIGDPSGGTGYDDTDLLGLDPMLGPLQDNGGPTSTMALLPGSPALDAGAPDELGSPDQRDVLRTGGVNIGSFQASATAFRLDAPATVESGMPFDMTLTAVDPFGQVAVGYTGTVTFDTTDNDQAVVLPADYAFTRDDAGVHFFSDTGLGETTLITPGDQTITATDTADDSITGSATLTVTSGPRIGWDDAWAVVPDSELLIAGHRGRLIALG
jgi:hypothetical protein